MGGAGNKSIYQDLELRNIFADRGVSTIGDAL
jgi:hypothetical protein